METIDIIRKLCAERKISVSQLENELGYGNGSIAKAKNMSADRIYQIAKYFNVSMEYILTGKTIDDVSDEMAILKKKQAVLIEMNQCNQAITEYYKKIADLQNRITKLKKDYIALENKNNKDNSNPESESVPDTYNMEDLFNLFGIDTENNIE